MDDVDPKVEVVARAMCQGVGLNPERQVVIERLATRVRKGPQWFLWVNKAKEQIAAFEALSSLKADPPSSA